MANKYSEIAERINSEIADPNLKKLLFGIEDPDADDVKGIDVLYRMMMFSFLFTYAKYKYDRNKEALIKRGAQAEDESAEEINFTEFPNATRVYESFETVYNGEDIGLDLIIYILSEIQLDVLNYDKKSYFRNIFRNTENPLQIPTLRNVIKTWLHSAKHAEKNNAKLMEYLEGLYDSLVVLRNVEVLKGEDGSYSFRFLPTDEIIPSYCLLIVGADGAFNYLGSYEIVSNNVASLSYFSLDGSEVTKVEMPFPEFRRKARITNNDDIPKTIFAKSLFSIGFKYIKNLSLAVSDTITKATKQKFFEHYSHKYVEVFEQLGYRRYSEVNWDNVLTILMFEEGPSELLEFVLDSDGFYFERILHNLEVRYNDYTIVKNTKEVYEREQANQMNLVRKYLDDNSSIIKNIITINKTLMAKCIIDALANLENSKKHSNTMFVESLPMRIRSMDKVFLSNESMESKVIKINKALEKTFRYLIPFYYGVIAYQEQKEEMLANFDNAQYRRMIETSGDIQDIFDKCKEKFYAAAREESKKTARMSIGKLVSEFRTLATSLTHTKEHRTCVTKKGKILKDAIGRSYLCNVKTFNEILAFDEDEAGSQDIVSFINRVKHASPTAPSINVVEFNKFMLSVKKLMYYLIYNEDYQREMILGQQISYDPIYPYVVRYTEKSENRDGYDINSFSVFITDESGDKDIKILSEREYVINEKYYCIPNVSTSNSRWWIEPFLISCRIYDEIISQSEFDDDDSDKDE